MGFASESEYKGCIRRFNSLHKPSMRRFRAFTLAEILIVIGIIGVIAGILIPSMIQKVQYSILVEKAKKSYSTLENSLVQYKLQSGDSDYINLFTPGQTSTVALNNYAKYISVIKNCGETINGGCWDWKFNMDLNGVLRTFNSASYARAVLADGSTICLQQLAGSGGGTCNDANGTRCMNIWIDVNGSKPPNVIGQDFFGFQVGATKMAFAWGAVSMKSILTSGQLIIYNDDGTGTIKARVP